MRIPNYEWVKAELELAEVYLKRSKVDQRWWIPNWLKRWRIAHYDQRVANLSEMVEMLEKIDRLQKSIQKDEQTILQLQHEIERKSKELSELDNRMWEIFVRKKHGAVKRESSEGAGLQSLLTMLVGLVIAIMIGVFLYLSPFFKDKSATERPSPELNKSLEVIPLAPQEQPSQDYSFYRELPDRKIEGVTPTLSQPKDEEVATGTMPIDEMATDTPNETMEESSITVTETDDTYDEPSTDESVKISSGETDTHYVLYIQSFDTAEEADIRRSAVLMTGVDAKVEPRELENGTTVYVVVSEPFYSKAQTESAYARLKANGIDSVAQENKKK